MGMKILYLAPDVSISGSHGGSSHVIEATKSLAKLGNKVYLLCRSNFFNFKREGNLRFIGLPIADVAGLRLLSYIFYTIIVVIFSLLFLNINIVYERGRIFGGFGVLLAKLFGRKSVYEFNEPYISLLLINNHIDKNSLYFRMIKNLHDKVVNSSNINTVTCDSMKSDVGKGKYMLVWWGTNPDIFKPNIKCDDIIKKFNLVKGKTFLYIGSYSEWHSCEIIIESINRLIKYDNEIKLIMIGKGKKLSLCKKIVRENNLESNVIFINKIDNKDMPKFINAADICFALFGRYYEPFKKFSFFYSPIKIHEYKACGKPVVASDFGNLKDLVKNKVNGVSVNEKDVDSVIKGIKILMQNKSLVKKIVENNRKEILVKYNWNVINNMVLKELNKIN